MFTSSHLLKFEVSALLTSYHNQRCLLHDFRSKGHINTMTSPAHWLDHSFIIDFLPTSTIYTFMYVANGQCLSNWAQLDDFCSPILQVPRHGSRFRFHFLSSSFPPHISCLKIRFQVESVVYYLYVHFTLVRTIPIVISTVDSWLRSDLIIIPHTSCYEPYLEVSIEVPVSVVSPSASFMCVVS